MQSLQAVSNLGNLCRHSIVKNQRPLCLTLQRSIAAKTGPTQLINGRAPISMRRSPLVNHLSRAEPTIQIASSTKAYQSQSAKPPTKNDHNLIPIMAGGALGATVALHSIYGSEDNYYEYRFTVDKDPDDLASFYGSEEFMDLFCVVPFMGTVMMRGGHFDDQGTFHTTGIPGTLSVNMVFSDERNAENGKTVWFNKRERFKDTLFDHKMWDTVMNFGFRTLPNGKIECYHSGEYFKGAAPPLSLVVKMMFQVHARWVAWATEHYLNNYAFKPDESWPSREQASLEISARQDMPLHLLKHHLLPDLRAMILGSAENGVTEKGTAEKGTPRENLSEGYRVSFEEGEMPQIEVIDLEPIEVASAPKPSFLITNGVESKSGNLDVEREGSVLNDLSITDQLPKKKIRQDIYQDRKAHRKVAIKETDFSNRDFGGNQAWNLLKRTNNPEIYRKVTQVAKERQEARAASESES